MIKKHLPKIVLAGIIFSLLIIFCAACTKQPAKPVLTKSDTVTIVKEQTVPYFIPGETIMKDFNYDSIRSVLESNKADASKPNTVVIYRSDKSHLELSARLDSLTNQLLIQCEQRGYTDSLHIAERDRIINNTYRQIQKAHESLLAKIDHKLEHWFFSWLWKIVLLYLVLRLIEYGGKRLLSGGAIGAIIKKLE